MTKWLFLILAYTHSLSATTAQDYQAYVKENAVKIDNLDSLNHAVWHLLSDYKLIMVGELHGTNEPAKFVTGLARLLSGMGDSVQIGLEIPSEKMTKYLKQPNDSNIYSSDFFAKNSDDGRASVAWAEVI
jgi:hypothetical protein